MYIGGMNEPENPSSSEELQRVGRPVFIVRFWWEPGASSARTPGEWRGSVELLLSGEQSYFRSLSGMAEIIQAQLKTFE
jgi:hypothetical protein